MDLVEVKVCIHNHPMTPLKDGRKCDYCGIKFGGIGDGYYCSECNFFIHKVCEDASYSIVYPSHTCSDRLTLQQFDGTGRANIQGRRFATGCALCGEKFKLYTMYYGCYECFTAVHIECSQYPPPEVIDVPQHHHHKLTLTKTQRRSFTCAACGKRAIGFSYVCHECHLSFHVSCEKYPAEVNHPCHSYHPLKLVKGKPPAYTDGKCRLCEKNLGNYEVFYHCSTCNFSLDFQCVIHPPTLYLDDLNTHAHTLTLMPKSISFTCTTCGLNGDRSPYVCLECDFTSHNDCSGFPWVININRHDHRVFRTSLIGVVNSVCGVCQKKMDWSCGGYSCKRCPESVFHTKCATRVDVWDGREMKDEPEEDEDIEPFKVIDENTIQHFSHEEHNLRLDKSGVFIKERGVCEACAYPIYQQSFYSCMTCDFILHDKCAKLPTRRRHVTSNKPYILHPHQSNCSICKACGVYFNGFKYTSDGYGLDARCASVSEPFLHQSHPHPLFYTSPQGVCSACNNEASHVLRCVEDNCGYILDFECALLPYVVSHRVDDHFLSLCYGEDANGKYWCQICEKETDPKAWFYTCKDCGVTLHTSCVLGDFRGLKPGRKVVTKDVFTSVYEPVYNNSMSRPRCEICKSRCISPIILKQDYHSFSVFFCSIKCSDMKYLN